MNSECERREFRKSAVVRFPWNQDRLYRMTLRFYRFPGEPWQFEHAGHIDGISWAGETLPETDEEWIEFLNHLAEHCISSGSFIVTCVDGEPPSDWKYEITESEIFGMCPIIPPSRKNDFWNAMAKAGGVTILANGGMSAASRNPSIRDALD